MLRSIYERLDYIDETLRGLRTIQVQETEDDYEDEEDTPTWNINDRTPANEPTPEDSTRRIRTQRHS